MFYQTKLRNVNGASATDVNGKHLKFVGFNPAQAGDTVWTDGKVIFGHIPCRSTPVLDTLNGIPVLGNKLRGYFKKNGKFKNYQTAEDDWIINGSSIFKHGSKNIDGQKVIDADIFADAQGKSSYIVTDGFYRKNHCVKYNHHMFRKIHSTAADVIDSSIAYSVCMQVLPLVGEEITLGVDSPDLNQSIKIFKGDSLIREISLQPYADFITEKCWTAEPKIMANSQNNNVNYHQQPPPPSDSFIASTYARPISFRISQNGDWDAIIFASSYGYCFPYVVSNGSVLEATFNSNVGASTSFSESLISCTNNIERSIFNYNSHPFLQIEKYPKFTGDKKVDGEYTDAYITYIEDKIAYYIPLVRFQFSDWHTVHFGASAFLRVTNGEIISVMNLQIRGGTRIVIFEDWDEQQKVWFKADYRFNIPTESLENDWDFPIEDGFYFKGRGNNIQAICDAENNVIADFAEIGLYEIGTYFKTSSTEEYIDHTDSTAEDYMRKLNLSSLGLIWMHDVVDISYYTNEGDFFRSTIQTYFNKRYPNLQNATDYYLLDNCFDAYSNDGFFRFNPCIAPLTNGNYLIGIHEGELFLKQDNQWIKKADNLKNFRLRHLKNISKAKK